jgi:hypothetical protein
MVGVHKPMVNLLPLLFSFYAFRQISSPFLRGCTFSYAGHDHLFPPDRCSGVFRYLVDTWSGFRLRGPRILCFIVQLPWWGPCVYPHWEQFSNTLHDVNNSMKSIVLVPRICILYKVSEENNGIIWYTVRRAAAGPQSAGVSTYFLSPCYALRVTTAQLRSKWALESVLAVTV